MQKLFGAITVTLRFTYQPQQNEQDLLRAAPHVDMSTSYPPEAGYERVEIVVFSMGFRCNKALLPLISQRVAVNGFEEYDRLTIRQDSFSELPPLNTSA